MIETILFDADGMIILREGFFSTRFAQEHEVDPEIVQQFFRNEWFEIVTGKADLKEKVVKYLDSWNWTKGVDELLKYWFVSEHHIDQEIRRVIQQLKSNGIGCYLASNQEKYRLKYISEEMGFSKLFGGIYSSCNIGFKKPDKRFFEFIWHDLGRPTKESILFWDDTKANVLSARNFGIQAQQYKTFDSFSRTMKTQYGSQIY